MDETLKITIGTLSGFVIAFFAEPVKIFFQNRAKRDNIKKALYHEMISNYFLIKKFLNEALEQDQGLGESEEKLGRFFDNFKEESDMILRTECFRYTVKSENFIFYQLKNASLINLIYGRLTGISTWLKMENSPQKQSKLTALLGDYITQMEDGIRYKQFEGRIVNKILGFDMKKIIDPKFWEPIPPFKPMDPLRANATRFQTWVYKLRLWFLSRR